MLRGLVIVADPGEGHEPPPLFLDQTEAREKKFLEAWPPLLFEDLDYRTPCPQPYLMDPALTNVYRQS